MLPCLTVFVIENTEPNGYRNTQYVKGAEEQRGVRMATVKSVDLRTKPRIRNEEHVNFISVVQMNKGLIVGPCPDYLRFSMTVQLNRITPLVFFGTEFGHPNDNPRTGDPPPVFIEFVAHHKANKDDNKKEGPLALNRLQYAPRKLNLVDLDSVLFDAEN